MGGGAQGCANSVKLSSPSFPSRFMYWTDWGDHPKIERAGLNGDPETRAAIVTEQLTWPNGLTIDYQERRLYWVDASQNYIHSTDLNGLDRWATPYFPS